MFTGIIEGIGKVVSLENERKNLNITIESHLANDLKIDQSLAHNGVCLTVVDIYKNTYKVTAIEETLQKSNLGTLKLGDQINLERAMKISDRLDGHIVQGHVDQVGTCKSLETKSGSWIFKFDYELENGNITIEKGSITVNGVSLTVINSGLNFFSVAIIPYTYENTNFHLLNLEDKVNLEFDILGKYIGKLHRIFNDS